MRRRFRQRNRWKTQTRRKRAFRRTLSAGIETLERRQLLAADVLFADSFESGSGANDWSGAWVEDSQDDWNRSTQRAIDGGFSAEVDGQAGNATLTMSQPIDLTGYDSVELTYSWFIESGFDNGEHLALELYDGNDWTEVRRIDGSNGRWPGPNENTWRDETVAIDSSYWNPDFNLRFVANVSSSSEDGFVDNVVLSGDPAVNALPIVDAGPDQTRKDAGGNGDEFITLDGSASDSDGTIVSYEWTSGENVLGTTAQITPTLDVGTHTLTLAVTDNDGATATDTVDVTINEVPQKPVKVFFLAGHSNMLGTAYVENLDPAWNVPQDDVWIWLDHNMDGGQWTTVEPGHGSKTHAPHPDEPEGLEGPDLKLGPELSLARTLADAYPEHQIAFVKHGAGGASLADEFDPDNIGPPELKDHMWSGLTKKIDDSLAVLDAGGYSYDVEGMFWNLGGPDAKNRNHGSTDPDEVLLGEQEALARSAEYAENLTYFLQTLRGRYGENLPFVMTQLLEEYPPEILEVFVGAHIIREEQMEVDAADPWTVAFEPLGLTMRDPTHFDANGQIDYGILFAQNYLALVESNANQPPVADDDAYVVDEDAVLNVAAPGVLNGDSDPENDTLTAALIADPAHGAVTLNTDGSFTYTPDVDYAGADSFTYHANDGTSDSNTATVDITVTAVNDAPAADSQSVSVKEDTGKSITLSASDVEGGSLTYAVQSGPASGSLSGTAPNLVYTPDPGFIGADSFTFVANDGELDSNLATVTIQVAENLAPVADAQAVSVDEDGSAAITLTGSDGNGDPITYELVGLPANGTLTGTAPNLVYTPNVDFHGSDSFTFRVNDGTDDSAVAAVTISVNPVNDAPVADAQAGSTDEDTPLAIMLTGSDIDGDALSFVVVAGPAEGSLSGTAPNLTYTPDADFHGSDSFSFKVNDGTADSAVVVMSITVDPVNDAPVASNDNYTLDQDATLAVTAPGLLANDSDVDGDLISSVLQTGPSNGSLTLATDGSFTYSPNPGFIGADSFTYRAEDPSGLLSAPVTVSLTVNAVAAGPNLSHGSLETVGSDWQTVTLSKSYTSMVVVATPRYNSGSGPGVVRVRNVTADSFEVRVDDVGSAAFSGGVHYTAVEEGVYDEPGQYKLEAVKYDEAQTSGKGGWIIDTASQGYQQSYSNPVVVGQVMTANDADWSVFWASGDRRTSPPTSSELNVGKHVAEDADSTRAAETIGYLVIEATQSGAIEGLPFVAGVGSDTIRGVDNGTYEYSYTAMPNAKTAVLGSAGMDGGDGGWAVLRGSDPVPASTGTIGLSIDEDQLGDSERKHTTEQVAYFVIDPPLRDDVESSAAANPELAAFFVAVDQELQKRTHERTAAGKRASAELLVPQTVEVCRAASTPVVAPALAFERTSARLQALDRFFSEDHELEQLVDEDLLAPLR